MLSSSLRLHCFSFKRAWMDVNCLCYILTEYQGFPHQIVIVLTVSEPLQVLTMDQRSPGSYKTSSPGSSAASSLPLAQKWLIFCTAVMPPSSHHSLLRSQTVMVRSAGSLVYNWSSCWFYPYPHLSLPLSPPCLHLFLFFFLSCLGILVPQLRIKPRPSVVKAQNPNHWTTRKFPFWHLSHWNHSFLDFFPKEWCYNVW